MTRLSSLTVLTVVDVGIVTAEGIDRFAAALTDDVVTFDFIIVANSVDNDQSLRLKALVEVMPDLTVVFLGEPVHDDLARLVGIEHAVGDYVLFADLATDDPAAIAPLLAQVRQGFDLVVGDVPGRVADQRPWAEDIALRAYIWIYAKMSGLRLERTPTGLRVLSRAAALFIAGRANGELLMRTRSIAPGFPASAMDVPPGRPFPEGRKSITRSWWSGIGLLLSVSALPLRGTSYLALLGGVVSVIYSLYVFAVYLFKSDVAAGWTTISLQLAAMTFVFSTILLFIAEYVVQIYTASPPRSRRYLVLRELRSPTSRRSARLNIVDGEGEFRLGKPIWLTTLDRAE